MEELSNPLDKFASQVYSADGKLIGTWNQENANRVAVDYNNLSPHLVHALVATEDERFYEHSGIDFIALGRAIIKRGVRRAPEAALPSRSSWPSSSTPRRHTTRWNDSCRSP